MTYFYYKTNTWNSQPQITEETVKIWEHLSDKKNWRIVQLPNGFYQTEYQDLEEQYQTGMKKSLMYQLILRMKQLSQLALKRV